MRKKLEDYAGWLLLPLFELPGIGEWLSDLFRKEKKRKKKSFTDFETKIDVTTRETDVSKIRPDTAKKSPRKK